MHKIKKKDIIKLKKALHLFLSALCLTVLTACQVNFWNNVPEGEGELTVTIERYDRLQSRYLNNADFSALQSMNTSYPMETRALIENVLQLGTVDQPDINERFLKFYQDVTLQRVIRDVDLQYGNMDDLNNALTHSFRQLRKMLPHMHIPQIYAQIGAFGQSIIVGDSIVGICLDKYLGKDYPPYKRFYTLHQCEQMTREYIVPDCLLFYLISLYPLEDFDHCPQEVRDAHIGRIMHVVNKAIGKKFYTMPFVKAAADYQKSNPALSWDDFLQNK